LAASLLIIVVLLLAGCKVDYDVMIYSDLSGKCVARAMTMGLATKEAIQQDLIGKGLINFSVSDFTENVPMGGGNTMPVQGVQITANWSNPVELRNILRTVAGVNLNGDALRRNADNSVTVFLGALASEGGRTRVNVEGTIDPGSTRGNIMASGLVEFGAGQQVAFSFVPARGISNFIKYGVIFAIICGLFAICIYAISKRKTETPVALSPEGRDAKTTQGQVCCTNCGTACMAGDEFCGECGNRIG
jgi:hypothetical protein